MTNANTSDSHSDKKHKVLWLGLALVLITVIIASSVLYINLRNREADLEALLEQQELTSANGRIQNITLWLRGLEVQGERIANSDIFRLFASDVDLLEGDVSSLFATPSASPASQRDEVWNLSAQLPMMRNMFREFTSYSGFISSRIVNKRGETYVSSETGVPRLTPEQMDKVNNVLENGQTVFSNAYITGNGLVMDMFMPIFAPQIEEDTENPVSVLVLSRIVSARISDFLKSLPLYNYKMNTYLVQFNEQTNKFEEVSPGMSSMGVLPTGMIPRNLEQLSFGNRLGVNHDNVYSLGVKIPDINWWLIQEVGYDSVRKGLSSYIRTAIGITVLVSLVVILVVSLLWWWLVGNEQRKRVGEVNNLLEHIEEQKQLLDAINSTISDLISLTDEKGVIRYANLAFANAVGRNVDQLIGLDIPALFGFDTGKRLIASDHHVIMSGESIAVSEVIFLQSKKYYFQIIKAPLTTVDSRHAKGIVSVYRDITDLVEAQERNRNVIQQTINALVHTIEESDTYLAGHSRFMSELATLLAHNMNLSEGVVATVEAAANLSQIGKMFVPKEILNKPGMLTPEEKAVMERHADHSRKVLQNIEFDLPILDAIYEMNERLDGTGYPRKLIADEIGSNARILAVANGFTAMARPRSYRKALDVNKILEIMRQDSNGYDEKIVASLSSLLESVAGERLLKTLSKQG